MDFVYLVRIGADNRQLRYSLRSIAHVPHDRVWLVGYRPPWVKNVEHIAVRETEGKWRNLPTALVAAASNPDLSDQFAYWNDDMYALRDMSEIPTYHHDPLRQNGHNAYTHGMVATRKLLLGWGIKQPLSYELHMPLVMDKAVAADSIARALAEPPFAGPKRVALMYRSVFANVAGIGGDYARDVKVFRRAPSIDLTRDFASTNGASFANRPGAQIRALFPSPSRYER